MQKMENQHLSLSYNHHLNEAHYQNSLSIPYMEDFVRRQAHIGDDETDSITNYPLSMSALYDLSK